MRPFVFFAFVACLSWAGLVVAWSKEGDAHFRPLRGLASIDLAPADHEIFRVRDEVEISEGPGVTFYDFLGVSPSASLDDINKAYRKKSRSIHPDKVKQSFIASKSKPTGKSKPGQKKKPGVHVSKGPSQAEIQQTVKQASERFARLGVIANILRDGRRDRYDHFLKNGFPRWRGTGYYYARFRPGLGSVLLGLLVVGGGGAHYAALYLGWKRQRDFVGRYIKHARRAAWGDEMGIQGIPGLDGAGAAVPPPSTTENEPTSMAGLNRRQRRMQERDMKKDRQKGSKDNKKDSPTPVERPRGERKRVVAENGKVLIVDSTGDVYLEEETEDGSTEEYLLDIDEIPKPSMKDTILFRFPVWLVARTVGRISSSIKGENNPSIDVSNAGITMNEAPGERSVEKDSANGSTRKRKSKK